MNEVKTLRPTKWGENDKRLWLERQHVKRSYADDVLKLLEDVGEHVVVEPYGALSFDVQRYPLYRAISARWDAAKPAILVTGGVHGYETSGVLGALEFIRNEMAAYLEAFNFVIFPCVSPWGYETINRWNPGAVDPNRSFRPGADSEEASLLMSSLSDLDAKFMAHFDLHETTDTDATVFQPALAARDGVPEEISIIPDGFYLVGDQERTADAFQAAVLHAVAEVSHIAPADENGQLIGKPIVREGLIYIPARQAGLCMGVSDARFVTTTEVYPDSPSATAKECLRAQLAALTGGIDYLLKQLTSSTARC